MIPSEVSGDKLERVRKREVEHNLLVRSFTYYDGVIDQESNAKR